MKAFLSKGTLQAFGRTIPISCNVHNELNNRRKNEVIRSIPSRKPIQPRHFPLGICNVRKPLLRDSDYLRPFLIPTDAWQMLPVWVLDGVGCYKDASEVFTKVGGYGLHFSTSSTTQGCIKIMKLEDLLWLVDRINEELNIGKKVTLEVLA